MKLVIPYIGDVHPVDMRLIRLAEFLGISCATIPADSGRLCIPESQKAAGDCLIVNPYVWSRLQRDLQSPEIVSSQISQFARVLVYCMRSDSSHTALLANLTAGRIEAVKPAETSTQILQFATHSEDVCGAFAGLSINVPNLGNDSVFGCRSGKGLRKLISVGEDALFATLALGDTEVLLLGTGDVADMGSEADDEWLGRNFTKLLPPAMALRYVFGDCCWRPAQGCATVIIDDPLLQPKYGFLNFCDLLRMMDEQNFATTIAFIPHNFRRSSPRISGLFQQKADKLSICFHGNDHTGAEFAITDSRLLNTLLGTAQQRMAAHEKTTKLNCAKVMVFPQGKFSVEAMAALRSQNFEAAINTGSQPVHQCCKLTLRELAQPAVLRYSGFPLFLRKYSRDTHDADIAFRLFFGVPILIVEHHDIFANPQRLTDAIKRVNHLAPSIRWCSAAEAVRRSFLQRRTSFDSLHVKAYARTICLENQNSVPQEYHIEWPGQAPSLDGVYRNGRRCTEFSTDESGVHLCARVDPGISGYFSVLNVPADSNVTRFGIRHATRVFVRRRLSEIRDNYISKSPALLAAAKSIQRSLQH